MRIESLDRADQSQVPDLTQVFTRDSAARWAALLGTEAVDHSIVLDGSLLYFEPRSEGRSGLCAIALAGPPRAPITIAGVELTVG